MDKPIFRAGVQDTGNPVFDATCNAVMHWPQGTALTLDAIKQLHGLLLELYRQEPPLFSPGERSEPSQ